MKTIIFNFLLCLPICLIGQSFPSDSKVIEDVKKYHGKIASAKVQNEWKLERESGYNFSNMAKRVVAATTIKENGVSKNIIGLAIYVRGGAGEGWNFSRYFVTSSETNGLKGLSEEQLIAQVIAQLKKDPGRVFTNLQDIAWVYDVNFANGFKHEVDKRSGDLIYKAQIEYELKKIDYYPFEGGLNRFNAPLEIYVRQVGSELRADAFSVGYAETVKKTPMTEKQFNACPTLKEKPFEELYGLQGPVSGSDSGVNKESIGQKVTGNENKSHNDPKDSGVKNENTEQKATGNEKKSLKLPKVKGTIKLF
ncbi:MAG: hypothetical protein IPI60_12155 [Saprospiraceae bacterium]|nr:hypothetical protein [Saprospiraceae bacterium]